jgi:hypothetical protein
MMSALGQVRVGQQTLKHTAAQGCSVPHPDLYRQLGREGQKRGRLRIERLEQRLGLFEILDHWWEVRSFQKSLGKDVCRIADIGQSSTARETLRLMDARRKSGSRP